MFIDTHCHLNMMVEKRPEVLLSPENMQMIRKIISDIEAHHVAPLIAVGTSLNETRNVCRIAQEHEQVFAIAGIHPCDAKLGWEKEFADLKHYAQEREKYSVVGIGETGLDFYHKPFDMQRQIDMFKAHIELALTHDLPIIVHTRESGDEILRVLEQYSGETRGIIHCFSQDISFAQTVIEWGWLLGIGGPITYPKNDSLREVVHTVGLSHIVLETDAPFLPPQQHRGKQNTPAYIPLIAQAVAECCEVPVEDVAQVTTKNARCLFAFENDMRR